MGDMADYYGIEADGTGGYDPDSAPDVCGHPLSVTLPAPTATIWVARDGQRVKVTAMTDSHLRNTIAMLRRSIDPTELGEWDYATVDEALADTCVTFLAMLAEAERRGLEL